uniref:Uncharacterized protein n=1 Tax=Phlebotomus papatasi TaxID=29031 RepID=A0A1B0D2M7_PHLPP
ANGLYYSDLNDGEISKNNTFWDPFHKNIQLLIFQDAFEVCNPIGAARLKNKLIGVYLSVGNLKKYNRSQVNNLYLIALCNESNFKYFGPNKILNELVNDIKILERIGINVMHENVSYNLRGSLFAILGDNLGSHQIGGFVENFSTSHYFCRICYITRSEFKTNENLTARLRTVESHEKDLSDLKNSDTNNHRGVKFNSIFNELTHYKITNPGMPPCIAHDFFEGIIPLDLCLIFKYVVRKGWMSYTTLIYLIKFYFKDLNLKASIKMRPNFSNILGRAYDIWCLIQIIPLICVEFSTDENIVKDSVYKMLILLKKIVDIVVAPQISETQRALLKYLIAEYLELRSNNFTEPLKPKHHFITHYPYLIRKFGPLTSFWTLRFESKHTQFKRIITSSRNYKNIPKLCSEKHQAQQSLLLSEKILFPKIIHDLSQQRLNTSIGVLNDRETLASPDSSFNQIFLLEPQPSTSRSFSSEEVRQETSTPIGNSGTSKRALREKFLGYAGVVIPWSRLDSDCLNALEEKKRLSATQLTKVCQMVVDEIRLTGYYVPCKVFHETAKSMCQQFPDTFIEKDDDDIIIGNGYLGLAEKLRNRNNYLNQPHKT